MEQGKYFIDNNGNCTIPEGVTEIEDSAFENCSSLISINIPLSVEKIGSRAFLLCTSLKSIHIPVSVTEIGEAAFEGCTSLENVNIPHVTKIPVDAFRDCISLKSIHIPCEVTEIRMEAFRCCSSLESVDISDGVREISVGAFINCKSLKSVVIPFSVIEIGLAAFDGCTSLEEVYIGSCTMNSASFGFCPSLKSVHLYRYISKDDTDIRRGAFDDNAKANATLYVPAECIQACREHKELGLFKNIEIEDPDKIEEIYKQIRAETRKSSFRDDDKINLFDFDF